MGDEKDPLRFLSPEEVEFVEAVANGKGLLEAARASGIAPDGTSDAVARRRALVALSERRIAAGLKCLLMARSLMLASSALAEVERIASTAKSDRTRLEAAKLILDLAFQNAAQQPQDQSQTPPSWGLQLVDVEQGQTQRAESERIPLFRNEEGS